VHRDDIARPGAVGEALTLDLARDPQRLQRYTRRYIALANETI
jgi:hypothetical protein